MPDATPPDPAAVAAPAPAVTPSPSRSRRGLLRLVLLVAVPAAALLTGAGFYLHGGRYAETDNAYVKADKVPVAAEVAGTVREVLVAENAAVAAGQPLLRLDPAPFEVAVSRAEAKLAQARTDLAALEASYREKQAEIALARTRVEFARKDEARQADLVARHFVPVSKYDDAKLATRIAEQQEAALEQDLRRIAESLGGAAGLPVERHPAYRAAEAELAQARLDLARIVVKAPVAGTVSKPPKPGQFIAAGGTALALVAGATPWIEANFTETDLTWVHPGQPVAIRVDTYPGVAWRGTVESLSPATGAEFSVIPPQNASGNWVKVAQRLPVRIRIDDAQGKPRLRAGLSAEVEIDTGHRRSLLGFSL